MKRILAFLLTAVMLTGCGAEADIVIDTFKPVQEDDLVLMEEAPVLNYIKPIVVPGILVNRSGYDTSSVKLTIIKSKHKPERFRIYDAATGEMVYSGAIEDQAYNHTTGEYIGYGDFTELKREGEFYIYCEELGYSYSFQIGKNYYTDQIADSLSKISERGKVATAYDAIELSQAVSTMLLSFELYPASYTKGLEKGAEPAIVTQAKEYAELLLGFQNTESGAVTADGTVLLKETAWMAAALAKFSYTYQKYDSKYATACLQAADKAWASVKDSNYVPKEVKFFAAAELYRASGKNTYHTSVKEYGKSLTMEAGNVAQDLGIFTYALTKRSVDVGLCSSLLQIILDEAESTSKASKKNYFRVDGSLSADGASALLWDGVLVASINYIITNSEYGGLIEKYHCYLAGTNEKAIACFGNGDKNGIGTNSADLAKYMMMLAEMISHEED